MSQRLAMAALSLAAVSVSCRSTDKRTSAGLKDAEGAAMAADPFALDTELGETAWPDERELTEEITAAIKKQIAAAYPDGKRPARRDAHPKAHGCVKGEFKVSANIPETLAHGAFVAGKSYKTWIRFSNGDADPTRPDKDGDARGMAIKVIGVPGAKLLSEGAGADTQDFVMINHPVFFVDNPKSYLAVIQKLNSSNPLVSLTAPAALGLKGALIAKAITGKKISSPLSTRYWSTVPYRLGVEPPRQAVKYSAIPCFAPTEGVPTNPGPDYLREAMVKQLGDKDACFEFLVQPRTTPSMSIENSMVEWKEAEAPFLKVATIRIPKQTFNTAAQHEFCENLSFTPWHTTAEHRPLGAVNRVRRVVYEEISKLRHGMNAAPRAEPSGSESF